jgi:hypothetical protein
VWGWAIEWCFFLIETTAILLYYYGWDRVSAKTHQLLAWVYAGASFLTLAVINGIVSFMLTPGAWLENGSFWSGVFNPGYLPQLVARTGASLALAGVYGLVTAMYVAQPELRERLVHWVSKWVLWAFALFPVGALSLLAVMSPHSRELALGGAAPVAIMHGFTLILSVIILAAAYFGPFRKPAHMTKTFAAVLLSLALLTTGGAEWVREGIRKPFVIYDYLSNPELLRYCPQAEKIYVGKKAAEHTLTQDEINALLVRKGREGKRVVRLKGGDPFVFGRGGEECEELAKAGIAFEVVPGITAAIGAPCYAGIPVTHRDLNSSFTFITGHEKEEEYKDKQDGRLSGSSNNFGGHHTSSSR